jgi:hypothetical protein
MTAGHIRIKITKTTRYALRKNMLSRTVILILIAGAIAYGLSAFYSDKYVSEREFNAMLDSGHHELAIIKNYLDHHNQKTDLNYDTALRLAARYDAGYLQTVTEHYANGLILLDTATAALILQQLPSESLATNQAAGRIYLTNEFNQYNPRKAVEHLEFAALQGDLNAAASLAKIFTQHNCYVGAVTWAREANKRDISSECTQLPVNMNLLNAAELQATVYNETELDMAKDEKRLPVLRYSTRCELKNSKPE